MDAQGLKEIAQVAGAVVAYSILVKVFDFVKFLRRDRAAGCDDDVRRSLGKVLRLCQRIADRLDLKD